MAKMKRASEKKKALKKEWDLVKKKEENFLEERREKKDSALNRLLADKVPEKLQSTLDAAFSKAFSVVFHKGTAFIEKTYRRETMEEDFIINSYAIDVKKGTRGLRTFSGMRERPARRILSSAEWRASVWDFWVSGFRTFLFSWPSC